MCTLEKHASMPWKQNTTQWNLVYLDPFGHSLMLAYRISEIAWTSEITAVLSPDVWCLVFKQYLYGIITVNSIHTTTLINWFWPGQVSARSKLLDHLWPCPLHMHISRIEHVRISRRQINEVW